MTPEPGACGAASEAEWCSEDGVWWCKKIPCFLSLTSWGREILGRYLRESMKNPTKSIKYPFPAHELFITS